MTKILIKRGQAEANLPTLDPGEPAITFDSGGKLWIGTPSGNLEITGGGSGSPGGSDTQIQLNDDGVFGASANLTFNPATNQMLVGGATAADSTAVFEAHDSIADMRFNVVNDTASADINKANVGFYLKNDAEEFKPAAFWTAGLADRTDSSEDSYLTVGLIRNGSNVVTTYFGTSQTYFNYNSDNIDTIIYGANEDFTAMVDAGENAFQVGFLTPGNIVDFRYAGIVFNNGENDINFRIAGNGVTNGYFYDAGLNRHGFGTGTPSVKVHVVETSGTVAIFEENASGEVGINSFYNPNTTDNNGALIRFDTDTTGTGATARSQIAQIGVVFTTHNHATRTGNIVFRNYQSGAFGTRMTIGAGVQVGSPTGGDKGSGTANFAGDIYKNNTAYTSPDYVLEHWATGEIKEFADREGAEGYYRLSIDESEIFVRENLHLPRISRNPAGIFNMADMALEKIEEAHIYIYELNYRIKRLEELLDLN